MSQPTPFIVAGIQCDPQIARPDCNLEMIASWAERAREAGAALAIFPECAVSGYCFDSVEEAMEVAEPVPGPATAALAAFASRLNLHLVAGMLERTGEQLYNVAALVGPGGLIGTYRKIHLPFLGVCHRKHRLSRTTSFGFKTLISVASQMVRFSTYAENSGFIDEANLYTTTIYGFQLVHGDNLCFIFAISADRGQL